MKLSARGATGRKRFTGARALFFLRQRWRLRQRRCGVGGDGGCGVAAMWRRRRRRRRRLRRRRRRRWQQSKVRTMTVIDDDKRRVAERQCVIAIEGRRRRHRQRLHVQRQAAKTAIAGRARERRDAARRGAVHHAQLSSARVKADARRPQPPTRRHATNDSCIKGASRDDRRIRLRAYSCASRAARRVRAPNNDAARAANRRWADFHRASCAPRRSSRYKSATRLHRLDIDVKRCSSRRDRRRRRRRRRRRCRDRLNRGVGGRAISRPSSIGGEATFGESFAAPNFDTQPAAAAAACAWNLNAAPLLRVVVVVVVERRRCCRRR